jgi:hypothetical protein
VNAAGTLAEAFEPRPDKSRINGSAGANSPLTPCYVRSRNAVGGLLPLSSQLPEETAEVGPHPLLIEGLGIAFVPERAASEAIARRKLSVVLDDWCPRFPGLCLYYPGHRQVPAGLRAFIDVLKEVAPQR